MLVAPCLQKIFGGPGRTPKVQPFCCDKNGELAPGLRVHCKAGDVLLSPKKIKQNKHIFLFKNDTFKKKKKTFALEFLQSKDYLVQTTIYILFCLSL